MDAWAGLTQFKPTTREVEAPYTLYIKQYPFKTISLAIVASKQNRTIYICTAYLLAWLTHFFPFRSGLALDNLSPSDVISGTLFQQRVNPCKDRTRVRKSTAASFNTSAMGSSVKFDETSPAALRLQATVFQKIKQIW
eukprot:gene28303-31413_t